MLSAGGRVEGFRLPRAAGPCVWWYCSVRFRQRCAAIATGERDRVGGARRRAPNTPGSPCHPRRFAVPSAYRVRLRVGRDTASCLSRPQAASLRLAPASRALLGEGDGVQHPRDNFRFSYGTEVSLCVWEMLTAIKIVCKKRKS